MKSRFLGAAIVGLWVTMMVALIRVEYGERVSALDEVPVERVMRKMLSQPDPLRLNIYYLGQTVGVARAEVVPIFLRHTNLVTVTDNRISAYRVQFELNLDLLLGELPVKLRVASDSLVTRRLELDRVHLRGNVNGTKFSLRAATTNGQIAVSYDLGDGGGRHQRNLDPSLGVGLARSLGLPDAIVPTGSANSLATSYTKAYFGRLNIAGTQQRAFLIETRVNEALWAKLWVDEGGQVLQAETSAGISARSDLIEEQSARPTNNARQTP